MKRIVVGALVGMAVCGSGLAWAQSAVPGLPLKPDEVVHTRQAGMAMVGGITGMMKAGLAAGVDVKTFEEPAAALAMWAKTYTSLFPDGTQGVADTQAKPEIWSDRAGFEKADAAFVTASANLAAAAKSGDKAAFTAAYQAEGQSCGGCHRNYKMK